MVMTRAEVLRATGPTSGSRIRCKMGATRYGKLVAVEIRMAYEAGAFPGSPVGAGAMTIIASYEIPHFVIDAYDVIVNRPKTAAYRAPGRAMPRSHLRRSSTSWPKLCGIDPINFRLMNAVKEGSAQSAGPRRPSESVIWRRSTLSKIAHTTIRSLKERSKCVAALLASGSTRASVIRNREHSRGWNCQRSDRLGGYRWIASNDGDDRGRGAGPSRFIRFVHSWATPTVSVIPMSRVQAARP